MPAENCDINRMVVAMRPCDKAPLTQKHTITSGDMQVRTDGREPEGGTAKGGNKCPRMQRSCYHPNACILKRPEALERRGYIQRRVGLKAKTQISIDLQILQYFFAIIIAIRSTTVLRPSLPDNCKSSGELLPIHNVQGRFDFPTTLLFLSSNVAAIRAMYSTPGSPRAAYPRAMTDRLEPWKTCRF